MPSITKEINRSYLSRKQRVALEVAQKNAEKIIEGLCPVYVRETKQLYTAPKGKLVPNGEVAVGAMLEEMEGMYTTVAAQRLVMNHVMNRCVVQQEALEMPPDYVPVKNGIICVSTGELLPWKQELRFFNELPVEYNPKVSWPKKILAEIKAAQPDPAIQYRILRSWALCLDRRPMKRQVELYIGDNDTRKSTLLNVLTSFLGKQAVANQTLEQLTATDTEAQRSRAQLIGKYANIFADLQEIVLRQVGMLKAIVGGDTVPCRFMYQSPVETALYAKLFFGCNKPPIVEDEAIWGDHAFLERFRITFFENQIKPSEIIEDYLERLVTPEELSGLLNVLIGILRGVRRYHDYGYTFNPGETKDLWNLSLKRHNKIAIFNNQKCVIKEGLSIPVQEYSERIRAWCRATGYDPPSPTEINKSMEKICGEQSNNRRVRVWRGVGWKDEKDGEGLDAFKLRENVNLSESDRSFFWRKVHQRGPFTFAMRQEGARIYYVPMHSVFEQDCSLIRSFFGRVA